MADRFIADPIRLYFDEERETCRTTNIHIVSYSVDELRAMRERGESQTDWEKVDRMTDEEIERLIAEDPDERDLTILWEKARPGLPEAKEQITIRIDADVLRFFKRQGQGYQTPINAVLRAYMQAHQER